MTALLALIVVALTSAAGLWIGSGVLKLEWSALRSALLRVLDCVFAVFAFAVLNFVTGVILLFLLRAAVATFVSSYHLSDVSFLILSTLQGIAFHLWRGASASSSSSPTR